MEKGSKYAIPAVIALIAVCLAIVCCSIVILYYYGDALIGNPSAPTPINSEPIVPTDTSNLPEWTIMVYADADDDVLEQDIWFDVNEMELVGSTPQMNVVVQMDRADGSFRGDGDWTDTRRLYITQDNDLDFIASPVVGNIGEADMGDPQTLVEFITWSIQ